MFSKHAKLSGYTLCLTSFQVLLCLFFFPTHAIADWNSGVTIEDISTRIAVDITDDGVHISLDLKESAVTQFNTKQTKNSADLNQFALNVISIQAGQLLAPILKSPINPDSKNSAAVITVFFPFTKAQPEKMEIIPDFKTIEEAGDKYIITVSHQGLPVIDHGVLTSAETLQLDWQDPWYSHFLNPKLQRGHSDPVMAFLYIEPQQIKSEVVVRIKEMASWANLELRDNTMIYPDEFATIKQKVAEFLMAKNILTTGSDTSSAPLLDRVDYIRMGASDIQAYEPQQAQKQVATLIGVSIIHPIAAIPAKIQWQWELFNEKIQRVAIRAYDPAGLFDSYVTPKYPVFEWENMLADIDLPELDNKPKVALIAVDREQASNQYFVLLGIIALIILFLIGYKFIPVRFRKYSHAILLLLCLASVYNLFNNGLSAINPFNQAKLDKQQAKPILNQLIWNVYQAFEATQENATYDQLAYSVDGSLIEKLYLQNRESFLAQDGAWSKVRGIEIQRINSVSFDDGYLFDCEWLVTGEVIHWGHQHRRDNVYHANIKISPIEGNWKITGLESIGQQRVDN
jgi:hypothetical protein